MLREASHLLGGNNLIQSVVVRRDTSVVLVLETDNDGVADAALRMIRDREANLGVGARKRKGIAAYLVDGDDLADLVEPVGLGAQDLHLLTKRKPLAK